jgi:hypothetical protein
MSDEPLRQERRKPIARSDFQGEQGNQPQSVNPQQFQQPTFAESTQMPPSIQPMPDPGFPVQGLGNAPPAFLERLKAVQQPEEEGDFRVKESSTMRTRSPQQQLAPNMRATGSAKLEDLIGAIKTTTSTYERLELPSLGKFYSGEDGPTDGIIHIRPMTGEEEQILATSRFIKNGTAINMIFNKCMRENYNSENFLAVDRTFLLIWLRGISYSREYDVEVICPYSDKKFAHTIDLDLEVTKCPPSFNSSSLVGVLPTTGFNFSYRLATGQDEQKISNHREKKTKFDMSNQADDTLLFRTAILVNDIEGLTDKLELQILLKKLPISDVAYLRNLTSEPPFGVDTKVTITSPFTMEDFEIDLPLEANFFFPKQRMDQTQA